MSSPVVRHPGPAGAGLASQGHEGRTKDTTGPGCAAARSAFELREFEGLRRNVLDLVVSFV
jgi:hypothetical protein